MKIRRLFIVLFLASLSPPAMGAMVSLYDGTGLPSTQPWLVYATDGTTATESAVAGGVRLQSDLAVSAGYSNFAIPLPFLKNAAFPTLNRNLGFELLFTLSIASETHSDNDRAGFSTILLGSDLQGIELAFWNNEIWAQSSVPLFTHAEGVAVDTSVTRNYRLQILNNTYSLFDGTGLLLSGSVRDYSARGLVYVLPNFVFLGDDTSRGGADITLGPITIQSDLTMVPEAASGWLVFAAVVNSLFYRRRQG